MILGSAKQFEFTHVDFDNTTLTAKMYYACGEHRFCEEVQFQTKNPKNLNSQALDKALKLIHLIAGVSYFKAFVHDVSEMKVNYAISIDMANFLNHLYEEGLGEFFYQNGLAPILGAKFKGMPSTIQVDDDAVVSGYSVGLGGGKDSLVAVGLLQKLGESPIHTYGINAQTLLGEQADILGSTHLDISRKFDINAMKSLKTVDDSEVPNGHVPISAILGSIGLVGAILTGVSQVVVAVERSANEPTREYMGKSINHQYSKTSDFEVTFNSIIKSWVSKKCGYFSILRPLRELDIMKLFFSLGLDQRFDGKYSSCNKALDFTKGRKPGDPLWCGECDKCAFIYLLMVGAGQYNYASKLFGSDLIGKAELKNTYDSLLGNTDSKPFDCVGELSESRESMNVAKNHSIAARDFTYIHDTEPPELWNEHHIIPVELASRLKEIVLTNVDVRQ